MKKIVALICITAIAFSLAACGGTPEAPVSSSSTASIAQVSSEATSSSEAPKAPELYTRENAMKNILDHIDVAYAGMTAKRAPMFFLSSSDGAFAVLVSVSSTAEDFIGFVGTTVVEDESGTLTITDSEKGYQYSFMAEAQADGLLFLDCGYLGKCYLVPDEIENVVDYINTVFNELDDSTDLLMTIIANNNSN